jgi:two-component system response regulator YesN
MDTNASNQPGAVRVLLVDDERGIRELFSLILANALPGVTIDVASNGAKAVQLFREHHYRVLTMDLNMPVMDGLTAFIEISRICDEQSLDMPSVVFCTGYAPLDALRKIVRGPGRHLLLSKPVKSEVLVEAIKCRL